MKVLKSRESEHPAGSVPRAWGARRGTAGGMDGRLAGAKGSAVYCTLGPSNDTRPQWREHLARPLSSLVWRRAGRDSGWECDV